MQKKLIALAIAGLSSAAFAQSNVTIYGVADVSFDMISGGGGTANAVPNTTINSVASKNRIGTNASYFGLKGTEDLGGGLKANWQIENEFDFGQGANNGAVANTGGNPIGNSRSNGLANRDSFVNLAGAWGVLQAGYMSSLHRVIAAKFDLMPGAAGAGSALNLIGRINTGSIYNALQANGTTAHTFGNAANVAGDTLANNVGVIGRHPALAYVSPTWSGFHAAVAYVPNETKDNAALATGAQAANAGTYGQRDPHAWNLAAVYENGGLALAYSYLDIHDFGAIGGATVGGALAALNLSGKEHTKAHLLGASYKFASATQVNFMYDRTDTALAQGPQAAAALQGDITTKRNGWYLGVKQGFGNSDVTVAYAKIGDNSVGVGTRAACGANGNNASCSSGSGANMWTLRYAYNFSKRTSMYAQYSVINNGSNASFDFGTAGNNVSGQTGVTQSAALTTTNVTAGMDPKVFSIGMRTNF